MSADSTVLTAGSKVPPFALATESGERFTEKDLLGRKTVLVFYPFAFSPVCTDQLQLYDEVLEELTERQVDIYGVSCDATWSQAAFRKQLSVSIPQLSDFEPKGQTCRAFGAYHPGGFPQRALVIVDSEGIVRFSYQAPSPGELPGVNVLFDGLATL